MMTSHQSGSTVFLALLLILALLIAPSNPANTIISAASSSQVQIEASDGMANDGFGSAVAINGDLLAIGAPYATINGISTAGAVYLYQRNPQPNAGWVLLKKLTRDPPSRGGQFGEHLAFAGDVLAVGSPHESGSAGLQQGAVYVFVRDQGGPNSWGLVKNLHDDSLGALALFGSSLALDGDLLAIGAEGVSEHAGAAFLYGRMAGWGLLKKLSDPTGHISALFGSAIALAGDTVVVGAKRTNQTIPPQNEGAALVFQRDQGGSGMWGLLARLTPDLLQSNAGFGNAVAISGDTIVVGELFRNQTMQGQVVAYSIGAAWLFERNQGGPNSWGRVKQLIAPHGAAFDYFGGQVAIVGDDLWIGAHGSDAGGFSDQGLVYSYARNQNGAGNWGALPAIEGIDGLPSDRFGTALSANSTTLVVGAPGRTSGRGMVFVIGAGPELAQAPFSANLPLVLHDWFPPTGLLSDGGTLQSPSGAMLGVVAGTLVAPVEATIMPIPAPTLALPTTITPVGEYYLVAGQQSIFMPANKPLLVGLPVPAGADPSHLAVAALVSNSFSTDTQDSEQEWSTIPGSYDTANNLFVITLGLLDPSGVTLVLFAHPDNQPLPNISQMQRTQQATIQYEVECDLTRVTTACTLANKRLVELAMEAAHSVFVDNHGFNPPNLVHLIGVFALSGQQPELIDSYYRIKIATKPCITKKGELINGLYKWKTLEILICIDDQSSSEDIQETVRHELFHAIQAAYAPVATDNLSIPRHLLTDWLGEGTANAAAKSSYVMVRRPSFPLREVTTPLTSTLNVDAYSAQDFWVYTGLERGEPISYLQSVFAQGATPEHVNKAFNMADAYWSWAKNQVFEHHQAMDGAFVSPACKQEFRAFDPTSQKFLFYPTDRFAHGVLPPLTSGLVEIDFQQAVSFVQIIADNDGDSADLRYKIYEDGVAGCQAVPDGPQTLTNLPKGARRYVLVSNVSLSTSFTYIVQLQGG